MKPRPVKVIWHDAAGGKTGWLSEDEARYYTPYVVESHGWLIRKDDKVVTLAISKHIGRQGTVRWADTLDVPRPMVRSVRYLS